MILFYSPKDPYGCFSNFSRHEVCIQDRVWPASEYPFQAMKFHPHRMDQYNRIALAPTPAKAAELGRDRSVPIRPDWDSVIDPVAEGLEDVSVDDGRGLDRVFVRLKDVIMYEVVRAKFSQNEDCKRTLLSTGRLPLIENAIHDPYWGWGCSRVGINKLGKILMVVRQELQDGLI